MSALALAWRRMARTAVLLALALLVRPLFAQEPVLSFGIVPQQAASKLATQWGPLLAEVGRRAGVELAFRTAPSIPAFEERLGKGEYDFAYMNPYHYVVFHPAAGYAAFAKEQDRQIKGIIVVRKDSRVTRLEELAGQSVAFPAAASSALSRPARAKCAIACASCTRHRPTRRMPSPRIRACRPKRWRRYWRRCARWLKTKPAVRC